MTWLRFSSTNTPSSFVIPSEVWHRTTEPDSNSVHRLFIMTTNQEAATAAQGESANQDQTTSWTPFHRFHRGRSKGGEERSCACKFQKHLSKIIVKNALKNSSIYVCIPNPVKYFHSCPSIGDYLGCLGRPKRLVWCLFCNTMNLICPLAVECCFLSSGLFGSRLVANSASIHTIGVQYRSIFRKWKK